MRKQLWAALLDSALLIVAYVLADCLRCAVWQHCSWPEVDLNYGSTLSVHLRMLAVSAVLWPLILALIGWHRPVQWPWSWLIGRVVAAAVLLSLSMAGFSLLVDRLIYPRAQIGFVMLILPVATLLARRRLGPARRRP
jgi:hypothetical protein